MLLAIDVDNTQIHTLVTFFHGGVARHCTTYATKGIQHIHLLPLDKTRAKRSVVSTAVRAGH